MAVVLLGLLAAVRARTPQDAAEALRALGTLLTVVMGLFSAMWWHQSTSLSDEPGQTKQTPEQNHKDSNILNGAAATTTGLALIGGVFSGLSSSSTEGKLAGITFLLLLGMSGGEIWLATRLSLRRGLHPRSALAIVVLTLASLLFVVRRLLL